jgi:RHS repeat-associated protein
VMLERETLHIMDDQQRIALVETKTVTNPDDESPTQLIRFQFGNHLGSASLELDDKGGVISYEEYYPYGSTAYHAVDKGIKAAGKRYRYTGMERDEETGLSYHSARYYVPWLGRWVSVDPAGLIDGFNVYCYTHNAPTSFADTDGMESEEPQYLGVRDQGSHYLYYWGSSDGGTIVAAYDAISWTPIMTAYYEKGSEFASAYLNLDTGEWLRLQNETIEIPGKNLHEGGSLNGSDDGVSASGVSLGNYQVPKSVADSLRGVAREGAYQDLVESVESGIYSPQSFYTAERFTPDQLVEFAEQGLPSEVEFSHIESLASSPQVGANSELGVLTDSADHLYGHHGGNYANNPSEYANPDWEVNSVEEEIFGEGSNLHIASETEDLGMTEIVGESEAVVAEGIEVTEFAVEAATVTVEAVEGFEVSELLFLLLFL